MLQGGPSANHPAAPVAMTRNKAAVHYNEHVSRDRSQHLLGAVAYFDGSERHHRYQHMKQVSNDTGDLTAVIGNSSHPYMEAIAFPVHHDRTF
jgi:hypothetical protein